MHQAELTECDDLTLLSRASRGELDAFGELVRRHQPAALRVAAVVCGSTGDADDIVQEAFVTAYARLASFRGTGSVRSWLLRIVANRAKNHVRSRVRRLRRDDRHARLEVRAVEGADHAAERRLEQEELAVALGRLPVSDRAVLGCRYLAGLSEVETGEVLGTPIGTVKSRTSRALVRLQRELAESAGGGGP